MKKSKKILSMVLALAMAASVITIVPFTVNAAEVSANDTGSLRAPEASTDFTYKLLKGDTAEITGYQGGESDIVIPSYIDGYRVVAIQAGAFSHDENLTSVVFPDTVIKIGDSAFFGCTNLASVTLPESLTSIGDKAFAKCTFISRINIPKSVTEIGQDAFSGCCGINTVTVENGNERYDSRNNCDAIIESDTNALGFGCRNTVIPDTVKTIRPDAFLDCTTLTNIDIPGSVTIIEDNAFYGCTALRNIVIPESVDTIGTGAFSGCTSLIGVVISSTVRTIGDNAFLNCDSLHNILIPATVDYINNCAFGYTKTGMEYQKVDNFTVYGFEGTAGHRYADNNGFDFFDLSGMT